MVEINRGFIEQFVELGYHKLGYSSHEYLCPIEPRSGEMPRCYKNDGVSHSGEDKFAMDIAVPDPNKNQLSILAPISGRVVTVIQSSESHGMKDTESKDINESWRVNTIIIKPSRNEVCEIKHFAGGSCLLRDGDFVNQGDVIAKTGVSGFYVYSNIRPDHVHFCVHTIYKKGRSVVSEPLRIRFKDYNIYHESDGSMVFKER